MRDGVPEAYSFVWHADYTVEPDVLDRTVRGRPPPHTLGAGPSLRVMPLLFEYGINLLSFLISAGIGVFSATAARWRARSAYRPFAVRINLRLPDHELCANPVQDEDAYATPRDAFDDMKRQLGDAARRLRGQEKTHPVELHGEVPFVP